MKKRIIAVLCILLLGLPVGSLAAIDPTKPTLLSLTINGTPVPGFVPLTETYNVTVPYSDATVTVAFAWILQQPGPFRWFVRVGGVQKADSTNLIGSYTFTAVVGINDTLQLEGWGDTGENIYSLTITREGAPPRPGGGSGGSAELPPDTPKGQPASIGNCKEYVPVHERPDIKSPVIGRIALGEPILLLQWNKGETWCKVLYNGENNTGWVQREYIIPQR